MGVASGYPIPPRTHELGTDSLGRVGRSPISSVGGGGGTTTGGTNTINQAFVVDPHLPPFNAKGDAVAAGDGTITGLNTLTSGVYTFTNADVGKLLWMFVDYAQHTITGVTSGGGAIFTPNAASAGTSGQVDWLCGSDDTAAIQAALNYAATAFAGRTGDGVSMPMVYLRGGQPIGASVQLRSGRGYIVGNTAASYDSGAKIAAVVIPPHCALTGSAMAGFANAALYFKPGSKGHVITSNANGFSAVPDFVTLSNLSIFCYGSTWNAGTSFCGVYCSLLGGAWRKQDAYWRMEHVYVDNAGDDGFFIQGARGEFYVHDCIAQFCNKCGFSIDTLADSRFHHIVGSGCGFSGIRVKGGGPLHFVECKSFYNGAVGGADDTLCCNYFVDTDNQYTGITSFTACEGQESRGSCWVIQGARCQFSNCMALDPGRTSFGTTGLPADIAGVKLQGSFCIENVFSNMCIRPTVTNFGDPNLNWGNSKWALFVGAWDATYGGPQGNRGAMFGSTDQTIPNGTVYAGIRFPAGGGMIGKHSSITSLNKNPNLTVNGTAVG